MKPLRDAFIFAKRQALDHVTGALFIAHVQSHAQVEGVIAFCRFLRIRQRRSC